MRYRIFFPHPVFDPASMLYRNKLYKVNKPPLKIVRFSPKNTLAEQIVDMQVAVDDSQVGCNDKMQTCMMTRRIMHKRYN